MEGREPNKTNMLFMVLKRAVGYFVPLKKEFVLHKQAQAISISKHVLSTSIRQCLAQFSIRKPGRPILT